MNVVYDLHIRSDGTGLVESREVRNFGRGDAKHDGHGAIVTILWFKLPAPSTGDFQHEAPSIQSEWSQYTDAMYVPCETNVTSYFRFSCVAVSAL